MSTSVKIETTTEVAYGDKCVYLKYDVFTVESVAYLPSHWSQLSFDDKYEYVNEHGHWVSGESEISDEQESWLNNNSDQHGLQSEDVIAITETYAIKEAF